MTEQPLQITLLKHIGYIPAIFIGLSLESFLILAVFMVLDTIVGVIRAMIVDGCRSFQSAKLTSGIVSKAIIVLLPLLIAWAGKGAGMNLVPFAQAILGLLIFTQLYSIIGNTYSIRMRKNVPEWDAMSFVLKKLQEIVEALIKNGKH